MEEGPGAVGTVGADHHPASGERIESELVHQKGAALLRRSSVVSAHLPATSVSVVDARDGPAPSERTLTRVQPSNSRTRVGAGWRRRHGRRRVRESRRASALIRVAATAPAASATTLRRLRPRAAGPRAECAGRDGRRGHRRRVRPRAAWRPPARRAAARGLVRYYRPGVNWVGRVLFAVPVLGVALLAMSGGEWNWSDSWVLDGMGVWAVVAVVAEAVLWPAERTLQQVVAVRAGALPSRAGHGRCGGAVGADAATGACRRGWSGSAWARPWWPSVHDGRKPSDDGRGLVDPAASAACSAGLRDGDRSGPGGPVAGRPRRRGVHPKGEVGTRESGR